MDILAAVSEGAVFIRNNFPEISAVPSSIPIIKLNKTGNGICVYISLSNSSNKVVADMINSYASAE